jgi:hypothetical protein
MLPKVIALTLLTFASTLVAAPAVPARLAIYYGYPGLINGAASSVAAATGVLAAYDVVVLGDGLEFAPHPDHLNTRSILEALRKTTRPPEVFGYVALGHATALDAAAIEHRARLWASMGATGIFYDEAGRDFGVSFARVAAAIRAARSHRLAVCLNAFDLSAIDEGMRDPQHAALVGRADAILVESFGVRLGRRQARDEVAARMRPAEALRKRTGVRVFGITTTTPDRAFAPSDLAYARGLAAEFALDAFGWGGADYGARDSRLATQSRP